MDGFIVNGGVKYTLVRRRYSSSGPFELVGAPEVIRSFDRNDPTLGGVSFAAGSMYSLDREYKSVDSVLEWWRNFESTLEN